MWRVSLAASLQFGDFSCTSLAAVSLWLHSCWLFSPPGLSSHVDPAGGKKSRQIQGKTLEPYKRFWLKFGRKYSFLHRRPLFFFFNPSTNFSLDTPSFLNFMSIFRVLVSSLWSFSRSQSPSHLGSFLSVSHSFIHSFCSFIHSLYIFPQLWLPGLIFLIFPSISSFPCP